MRRVALVPEFMMMSLGLVPMRVSCELVHRSQPGGWVCGVWLGTGVNHEPMSVGAGLEPRSAGINLVVSLSCSHKVKQEGRATGCQVEGLVFRDWPGAGSGSSRICLKAGSSRAWHYDRLGIRVQKSH